MLVNKESTSKLVIYWSLSWAKIPSAKIKESVTVVRISIPLCVYKCRLFSFQYYVANFTILLKTKCMSIYYYIRHGFRKLAVK